MYPFRCIYNVKPTKCKKTHSFKVEVVAVNLISLVSLEY